MAYALEGQLLEVCTCNILCPCWVGEDPDGGTCDGVLSWHIDKGKINGTDVSGRTFTILTHIPCNILDGNWRVVVYVDDGATDEQQQGLLDVWTGKLGGPIADLAQLVGEVMAVTPGPADGPQPFGSAVTITVSAGLPQVAVPDVLGKNLEDATAALQAAGLVVDSTRFLGNKVRAQQPTAGEVVEQGSTVKILVAP